MHVCFTLFLCFSEALLSDDRDPVASAHSSMLRLLKPEACQPRYLGFSDLVASSIACAATWSVDSFRMFPVLQQSMS